MQKIVRPSESLSPNPLRLLLGLLSLYILNLVRLQRPMQEDYTLLIAHLFVEIIVLTSRQLETALICRWTHTMCFPHICAASAALNSPGTLRVPASSERAISELPWR